MSSEIYRRRRRFLPGTEPSEEELKEAKGDKVGALVLRFKRGLEQSVINGNVPTGSPTSISIAYLGLEPKDFDRFVDEYCKILPKREEARVRGMAGNVIRNDKSVIIE